MKYLPWIMAAPALAVGSLTCPMAFAQIQLVAPAENGERLPQATIRAREHRHRSLSNQLRPYYRYELMHVRTACGLTRDQLREIRPEADAAYEQAIGSIGADAQRVRSSRQAEDADYLEAIHQAVVNVFRRHLTLAQRAAYEEDLRLRQAGRKEAGGDLMVAVLDRELLLTQRQRQQIAASLSAHWDDHWCDAVEVAFSQQSCCPRFPDRLVAPYLSPAQQETYRRIARFQGRLWGVTIDHGGDAAMEDELGADAEGSRPAGRRPVIAHHIVWAPEVSVEDVQVQKPAVRAPVGDVRLVPHPAEVEEPDAEEDPALVRQRQQWLAQQEQMALYRQQYFDRVAFGRLTEDAARAQFESILAKQIDHLERACALDGTQKRKLHAAGQGDFKRFFDRVAEARRKLQSIDDLRALMVAIQRESAPLAEERNALLAAKGPIFTRTVSRTLTDDQRASLETDERDRRSFRHRADVRWTAVMLARSLGLIDDQRRRLESVLLKGTRPPLKFGTFDYAIVMYQASRIPEEKLRPIFDDLQWRVMTQEFAAMRRWQLHLKSGGFLPDKVFDDGEDGTLPPIHLLDPPQIRSR